MAIMKRTFISLGIGIVIPVLLIVVMLTSKLLNGPEWASIILWVFAWPLPVFIRLFPRMSQLSVALISFSVGAVLDVVILFFLTYAGLTLFKRDPRPTQLPPPPPSLGETATH